MITRRGLILAAPAIVMPTSLMKISTLALDPFSTDNMIYKATERYIHGGLWFLPSDANLRTFDVTFRLPATSGTFIHDAQRGWVFHPAPGLPGDWS